MLTRLASRISSGVNAQFRNFGRDAAVIFFSRILQNANGFLLSVIVVRQFGLSAVGLLTISTIGTFVLATLLTFGLPYILAKSTLPIAARNAIGLTVSIAAAVISIPICAILGLSFGHDLNEAAIIAILALGGPFFAQTTIANSLLVLQNRSASLVLSPLANLIGLAIGYFTTKDFVSFALILAICRFIGVFAILLRLPLQRFSIPSLRQHVRQGLSYVTADTIGLMADQAVVVIASLMMTRVDLGIFGLCRQILSVGDTPAWSRLVTWYPKVCEDPHAALPAIRRQMQIMSLFCAAGLALGSVPLGLWFYKLPAFAWMAPAMMCCVPFRYMVFTYEMSLRALGALTAVNALTVLRCILVVLLPIGIFLGNIYGAIAVTIIQAIILTIVGRWLLNKSLHTAQQKTILTNSALGASS